MPLTRRATFALLGGALALAGAGVGVAAPGPARRELRLAVQPLGAAAPTHALAEALARVLAAAAGRPVAIDVAPHPLAHWLALAAAVRGEASAPAPDVVVEEAPLADLRRTVLGHRIAITLGAEDSVSIVTARPAAFATPEDLRGEVVATVAPPTLTALRVAAILADPLRAPTLRVVADHRAAAMAARGDAVAAAAIPTRLLDEFPDLTTVVASEDGPGPAVLLAPGLDSASATALTDAVLAPPPELERRLHRLGLDRPRAADPARYEGQAGLLAGLWPGRPR
ncbi:MAG: hypothetical protein H6983_21580 [Ectothiorhodospiraceae bacterium]|nr:hypothetical protein [Chromatiales bacterium]MCP5156781.1 hypothetical protein [Ectothiorhodospiraceae bacterium]